MTSASPTHKSKHGFRTEGQNGKSKCRLTLWKASSRDKSIGDKTCKTAVLHGNLPGIIWYHSSVHLRTFKSSIPICLCILILHLAASRPITDSQFMACLSSRKRSRKIHKSLSVINVPQLIWSMKLFKGLFSFYEVFKVILCIFKSDLRVFYCDMIYKDGHKI